VATQQLHLVVAPAPPASLLPPGAAVDNRPEPDTDAITRQFARVMGAGEGDLAVDPSMPPPSNLGAPVSFPSLATNFVRVHDACDNKPHSPLIGAAVCSIFCCPLVGIPAVWHALQVQSSWRQNEHRRAYMHAAAVRQQQLPC
jgi:hypothetical protein